MTLSFTGTLPLKQNQTFKGELVSGLARGDYVKKAASGNTSLVKVSCRNGIITLKAQKKAGTAKITITLASGLTKTFKVKVQKVIVKTTRITVASRNVKLKKKEKFDLETVIYPLSSTEKVTYTTSNRKVATVKNGVITAGKKAGTATITVKSGSKMVKVKVTVR